MKIILLPLLLIFLTINLYADKNWIPIEPINKTKTEKSRTQLDVNLSQIEPINKMMKRATVIKQLIDVANKKDTPVENKKNWFELDKQKTK